MVDRGDNWKITRGRQACIASVLALWQRSGGRPSLTDNEQALRLLLDRDPGALLVAEVDGAAVGALIAAWDGWRGSFYRLAVDPARRRRGIATALVRAGERRLEELGAERLTAIVVSDADDAVALWEAAGYRRQPEVSRFVRMVRAAEA